MTRAMRKYQNCIAKIPTQDCSDGLKIPFSEESRYYVSVLKKKYEWVCNGNGGASQFQLEPIRTRDFASNINKRSFSPLFLEYMCNPEMLLLYLSKCEASFMKSRVQDYIDVDILGSMDCR